MTFNHLNLMLTDNCPLQCAHCCVESGPNRQTTMALEDALSYVRQAHAMNPNTVISFTGGEPFVRYPLMRALATEAHRLGMEHTTITSAVWCKSTAFAQERLAELKALGLRAVNISYDAFHQPWVTGEQVRHCAEAAAGIGLPVFIAGSVTKSSTGARELLGDWPQQLPNVFVDDHPVEPTGRAALIPLDDLLIRDQAERNPVCPMASELLIEPDGSTYPCCSTGGDASYLLLGNARETPLAELRLKLERTIWFRLIATDGFRELERVVRRYDSEVEFPRRYIDTCHLCQLVLGSSGLGGRVRAALERDERASADASTGLWEQLRAALR